MVNVKLDSEDREAVEEINDLFSQIGILPELLAAVHVYSWLNTDSGIISVMDEDWINIARTIKGSSRIVLIRVNNITAQQYSRHQLRGTPEQANFWLYFQSSVSRAIKGLC